MNDTELLDRMRRFVPPTADLLGQEILELDSAKGWVRMKFQPRAECCNPMGTVQGGIVVAMLDDAAAFAAIIKAGERIGVPTIELKTSFFAPVPSGVPVFVEGRCLKLGKRIAFMESDMTDAAGKLLARLSTSAVPLPLATGGRLVDRGTDETAGEKP